MGNISAHVNPEYYIEDDNFQAINPAINYCMSGVTTYGDVAFVDIASSNYNEHINLNASGFNLQLIGQSGTSISSIYINNSGILDLKNINCSGIIIDGSGNTEFSSENGYHYDIDGTNMARFAMVNSNLYGSTVLDYPGHVDFRSTDISGNYGNLTVYNADYVNMSSGYLTHSGDIAFFQCSGFNIDHMAGYDHCDFPILASGCSGFYLNHVSVCNMYSGCLYLMYCSGDMNYSILAASGGLPISGYNYNIESYDSCIYQYEGPLLDYSDIKQDPKFADPTGNLKLNANSPCACAADYILPSASGDYTVERTLITPKAVKFMPANADYLIKPSGHLVHIIQGGKAVYVEPDSGIMQNDMRVIVNSQITSSKTITTVQSLSLDGEHPFQNDYKVIGEEDHKAGKMKYSIVPYSIIPLNDLLTYGDDIENVYVSGRYQKQGLSIDTAYTDDGIPYYWVGERNNQYIHKVSSYDNNIIETHPIFPASGRSIIKMSDLENVNSSYGDYDIRIGNYSDEKNFYRNEEGILETRIVNLNDKQPILPWYNAEMNDNMKFKCLLSYKDWLYILGNYDGDNSDMTANLYIYNKYNKHLLQNPVNIISGVPVPPDNNPVDMTIDDMGNLYIASTSGHIHKYTQHYDYALLTRDPGTRQTTITFREKYEGVDI